LGVLGFAGFFFISRIVMYQICVVDRITSSCRPFGSKYASRDVPGLLTYRNGEIGPFISDPEVFKKPPKRLPICHPNGGCIAWMSRGASDGLPKPLASFPVHLTGC
jgi:hypothetical protein